MPYNRLRQRIDRVNSSLQNTKQHSFVLRAREYQARLHMILLLSAVVSHRVIEGEGERESTCNLIANLKVCICS